ncbi:CLUMA_CG009812, isoform A [Clunio marinus]|uniref:CLUMA_CG009812, isoform A n=1 Tax=Clunio marinus TaxID=568069 RepID=A0A1J1I855_9DIPT|nr:CLUMA_CG009812, isoform A [Clunio marinus]
MAKDLKTLNNNLRLLQSYFHFYRQTSRERALKRFKRKYLHSESLRAELLNICCPHKGLQTNRQTNYINTELLRELRLPMNKLSKIQIYVQSKK